MITVHHLNNSRSQRVLWLLEELGLDYEIKFYQRDPKTMLAPPELLKVHPLGKSPVITDGELTVAESGNIIEYLLERYGAHSGLLPASGTPERLRYRYWLHFAEGSAMPWLVMQLIFAKMPKAVPTLIRPIARMLAEGMRSRVVAPQQERQLRFMEDELGQQGWFAGAQFSGADIQMSFPVEALRARGGLDGRYPNLLKYLEAIHARPAYQRALEKGGPYELLR
ncbi:glutathione S-transferase [Herbaspirillum seropedicae]|uniref:glutathione transferase n=1 Tax=Herbaspirillum seropedicae (strain SmR1) TaxID=757424 RepID=D8IQU0_HERSS|nr:glutathione S-transferase [Herbaspirillum seropedicae]ADJ63201.1 glutathione S-transferase family protein [Herbaspirillum seropedicae SmR1]AKN65250.1 glutathione S-transferase [Herbaspirillum seropedicae]NQE31489.1 glutathione S-transferase [Herbaspirillum seropedicae]UMU21207.1 glutathione S-transferase [Herbaspirillum seropedicae]